MSLIFWHVPGHLFAITDDSIQRLCPNRTKKAHGLILDRHWRFDSWVWIITFHLKVLEAVIKNALRLLQLQLLVCARLPGKLLFNLLNVVVVDMHITTGPDEFTDFKVCLLSKHMRQRSIRSNVEWNSQKHIRGALVDLHR